MTRVRLDASVRRSPDGRVLSGGHPARVMRLSAGGAQVLDAALAGAAPTASGLVETFIDRGLVHPIGDPSTSTAGRVTFVVPARNCASAIVGLVGVLRELGPVIVVDDRSTDDTAAAATRAGALVMANALAAGPAGARTTGLRQVKTDLVAFVDSDCLPTAGWLGPLVSHMSDRRLAIAAPRVVSVPGRSVLARYEQDCSPLDLGPQPSLVSPGRRLAYVPSAALLARTQALLDVDGFDPALRYGEDVDLVRRLVSAGHRVRYAPESTVGHRPRPTLSAFVRQRYGYGTSAAKLETRHPGAAAPLHVSLGTAAIWAAALVGPKCFAVASVAATLPASRFPKHPTAKRHAVWLAARGHVSATRFLARALAREWLPAALLLSLLSPRVRHATLAAVAIDVATAVTATRQRLTVPVFAPLRVIDNASYAAGVWRGGLGARSAAALCPRRAGRAEDFVTSPSTERRWREPTESDQRGE